MSEYEMLSLLNAELRRRSPQLLQGQDGFWRIPHAADSLSVQVESGTKLDLNGMIFEIKDSCTIEFPIAAMYYTIIAFSKKPRNLQYTYRYVFDEDIKGARNRDTPNLRLPDGTTLDIVNGAVSRGN